VTALPYEKGLSADIVEQHGLTPKEYGRIVERLNRAPNMTELGIFSVMWSEHCSYKSSRKWLKTLPTEGPHVICGPGENAGIVDLGDGQAAIFKMESHNHPSFIEPYQGAATGVGGILRDVFTMGARPIANMNALRFGDPSHEKTRHLVAGVVAGIGGYGNCIGVPTVGGEVNFHRAYNGNILVNAMTVGVVETDKIFYSAARGVGNPVVYVGSKTGRDGIHGATMASAEFDDDSDDKRPTVQVGDPFTEKLLLEACLELMAGDAIIAIQDMGAAGLTSSSVEMAGKGGVGIELELDKVPCRETGMRPYEMMLSESQERMLLVLKPGREEAAKQIFVKWGLDVAVIGKTTDTGRMVLLFDGHIVADIPIDALTEDAPIYDRPWVATAKHEGLKPEDIKPIDHGEALKRLMSSPDLASKRWIWEQYDSTVMADTIVPPGGDAAVIRVHGTDKAIAITTDVTPRYCFNDPLQGGRQAVAEAWRNLIAVGATPLGITDCLNFGNPERPEIMGQFVDCVKGIAEACQALDFPVVSGNVSFYNETNGKAILPTPTIGGVGLIRDVNKIAAMGFAKSGDLLVLIGETKGHLGASLYAREIAGREDGAPPDVTLEVERRNGDFVRDQIEKGVVSSVHDLSDGGLWVAVAEMALAGNRGANIEVPKSNTHAFLFGEDQARYVITCAPEIATQILSEAATRNVPAETIGQVGGKTLTLNGQCEIDLQELRNEHEGWLPTYMG